MEDLGKIADELYRNYYYESRKAGTVTAKVDLVVDPICKRLKLTRQQFGKQYLEPIQMASLRREIPYGMMLEVDMTWTQVAAFNRRKPENKVTVFDRPVYIIEMSKRGG